MLIGDAEINPSVAHQFAFMQAQQALLPAQAEFFGMGCGGICDSPEEVKTQNMAADDFHITVKQPVGFYVTGVGF